MQRKYCPQCRLHLGMFMPTGPQAGHTLVLRALGSRSMAGGCTQLQEALRQALGLRAAGNLYATPAGQQGLAAHYDDHCEAGRSGPLC